MKWFAVKQGGNAMQEIKLSVVVKQGGEKGKSKESGEEIVLSLEERREKK